MQSGALPDGHPIPHRDALPGLRRSNPYAIPDPYALSDRDAVPGRGHADANSKAAPNGNATPNDTVSRANGNATNVYSRQATPVGQ